MLVRLKQKARLKERALDSRTKAHPSNKTNRTQAEEQEVATLRVLNEATK